MRFLRVSPAAASLLAIVLLAATPALGDGENDPFETVNRKVFAINDTLDRWAFEPVARGWNTVIPGPAQRAIERFFNNIDTPTVLINELLQGKPRRAGITLTRFAFNSTFGVLGFFDPATDWGLERGDEEFGQTLGVWGVPAGPYLMLPFFGPYTVRDGAGICVDWATAVFPFYTTSRQTIGATLVDAINWRAQSLDQINRLREASIDFYVAVRNGYLQRREALIADRRDVDATEEEDLYFFEDEEEFDLEEGQ